MCWMYDNLLIWDILYILWKYFILLNYKVGLLLNKVRNI